ncbi:hypothetical protein WJX72_010213 [[Myrmecia] bisecta]|uniref:Apple domain-containing protein n=1 Tax=[Myrmecia] bisecta TaxID=41462 RepID=A0AAW1Q3S8_9CHLO
MLDFVEVQADLVVLDVNSQTYNGGPNHPPQATNAATCCDACKANPKCNIWVFCNDRDGCTSGCNTKDRQFNPSQPSDPQRFGQFGSCGPGGKWPGFMCSLKHAADPCTAARMASEVGPQQPWVSGTRS